MLPGSWRRSELCAIFRAEFSDAGEAAQLEGPHIGDDRPAVSRRNLAGVAGHGPEAVADHRVHVTIRNAPQPVVVERRRAAEAALDDHAVAVTNPAVAGAAVDVIAVLAPFEQFSRGRHGHVDKAVALHAREEDR